MTTRSCLAKNIPALWLSVLLAAAVAAYAGGAPAKGKKAAPSKEKPAAAKKKTAAAKPAKPAKAAKPGKTPAPGDLAGLVSAWRTAPSAARLAAIESHVAARAKDKSGPLARFALGVVEYEARNFTAAAIALKAAKIPQIDDYAAYYLGAARVEAGDTAGVDQDLAPVHAAAVVSPYQGRAWLLEARAARVSGGQPGARASVELLRRHYADLPQPEGDLALADSFNAAGNAADAAGYYQRVYYSRISGDAGALAAAALAQLKSSMGAAYPRPAAKLLLQRADLMLEARDYARARAEYDAVGLEASGPERDLARVRYGAARYLAGDATGARSYLAGLNVSAPEADAERLYYLGECARRLSDDEGMMAMVKRLAERYPNSPWRLKELVSAANHYLLANQPDSYTPLYRDAYEAFPSDPQAATCHWKVTFRAWITDRPDAADLLREQARNYPSQANAGAALYFLGRGAERSSDNGSARAFYERISRAFPNTYYATLARLRQAGIGKAAIPEKTAAFLASLKLPAAQSVPADASPATALRIERSRLLRAAGLSDLADFELRFGARTGGQPALLGMEIAAAADAPHVAMRAMKGLAPEYLNLPLGSAPRKYWEMLFPLPYRTTLTETARAKGLDPYLVAGLIRQESEFNPQARSRANAYGLTQVRPSTGKLYARQAGVARFSTGVLTQPEANLKIGMTILRGVLDQNAGKVEAALAAYNAGPNRASDWLLWNTYREPAEFVETIPFTETRDYVQAVLRNADIYRRLYGGQ
jgi:soluble lytic murein transglycosylase